MAVDVFSVKNNITVEFQASIPNTFIWGVSEWDDGNWDIDGGSEAYQELQCETFDIQIEKGCDTTSGIFLSPSSSVATISMRGAAYDPFNNRSIHAGTPIRISAEYAPDTAPGATQVIWNGFVRDYTASYDQRGNNVVIIHAVDGMQDFLNTRIDTYTITGPGVPMFPGEVISDLCNTYSFGVAGNLNPDMAYMMHKTYTNTTVGEIIKDCLVAGLGAFWMDRDGYLNYRSEEDLANTIESSWSFHFSTTHSTDFEHICMTDLVMKADSRDLPNDITATNPSGAVVNMRNIDAYDLFGSVHLDVAVPVESSSDLQNWLDRINLTTKLRRVETLNFDAASRTGQLWYWWLVDRLFDPNIVSYNLNGINFSETYFVTKQTDTITPYSWDIGLELWRGI